MNRIRKGVVLLLIATCGAAGIGAAATEAQAATTGTNPPVTVPAKRPPVANTMGSVWM